MEPTDYSLCLILKGRNLCYVIHVQIRTTPLLSTCFANNSFVFALTVYLTAQAQNAVLRIFASPVPILQCPL